MKYGSARIGENPDRQPSRCVVPRHTPLGLVMNLVDATHVPFVLIEDSCGQLMGIVETETIIARLAATHEMERKRWAAMPIEAALQWKISSAKPVGGEAKAHRELPVDCTALSSEDGVVALVSGQDVFLSWQSVRESLLEATVDSVTSLPNRLVFERRVREERDRAARLGYSLAVVLFDVDHFKEVNDRFGHSVGDATLEAIAGLLKEQLRSYDVLTRYGGDEFAAICGSCRPGEIDLPLLRIMAALKTDFASKSIALPPISLSIGAVVAHDVKEGQDISDLVELADMCLYRAKENGRDCSYKIELQEGSPATPTLVEHDLPITSAT